MQAHRITMLGTGLIGHFYTLSIQSNRSPDQVSVVYSRRVERAKAFASEWQIPRWTDRLEDAINDPATDTVVIGLPNHMHEECVQLAAAAGKAVLCTKPLGRTADEARRMLEAVEAAGVFHGYLEDLAYTPKTLKSLQSVQDGSIGDVLWVRSRETHPGPHSDWFWDRTVAGGGAILDLGCHTVEVIRNFMGKHNRPMEVMCWADTMVHPIEAEDHAIALIRFESGAMGQFEVGWAFPGGMDIRDEVAGTDGVIMLNHFLRTGFEIYSRNGGGRYVAEKAEAESGWLFPVGDEVHALGYQHMFSDMFSAMDAGKAPMESFYDGYVVNAVLDACYRSARTRQWEPVDLAVWRPDRPVRSLSIQERRVEGKILIKEERMPGGVVKRIVKDPETGAVEEVTV